MMYRVFFDIEADDPDDVLDMILLDPRTYIKNVTVSLLDEPAPYE
jgi:hypothetical protein|tara:strand:+ start:3888 stop:4022 length:135 start_codon:yes stop_codon:yes gene_type:complete